MHKEYFYSEERNKQDKFRKINFRKKLNWKDREVQMDEHTNTASKGLKC
jgi:hypothetical protein